MQTFYLDDVLARLRVALEQDDFGGAAANRSVSPFTTTPRLFTTLSPLPLKTRCEFPSSRIETRHGLSLTILLVDNPRPGIKIPAVCAKFQVRRTVAASSPLSI